MKIKAIREYEKIQRQGIVADKLIVLTMFILPSMVLKLLIFFAYMMFLLWKDLKLKKDKSENLGGDYKYYYSYFPFSKEDFLKAWLIDDLVIVACIIITPFLFKLLLDYDFVFYKPILVVCIPYFFFVGIFKPAKIYSIFYNSKKKPALYNLYTIISVILLVMGVIYTLAFITSFNSPPNILVEKIITRQSLIVASAISFAIYLFGNLLALVDWDKTYKEI